MASDTARPPVRNSWARRSPATPRCVPRRHGRKRNPLGPTPRQRALCDRVQRRNVRFPRLREPPPWGVRRPPGKRPPPPTGSATVCRPRSRPRPFLLESSRHFLDVAEDRPSSRRDRSLSALRRRPRRSLISTRARRKSRTREGSSSSESRSQIGTSAKPTELPRPLSITGTCMSGRSWGGG